MPTRHHNFDDEFMMGSYKIKPCPRVDHHNWKHCPWKHESETAAQRRHPSLYKPTFCSNLKMYGSCAAGDSCTFSHNTFEMSLHPERYKTTLCNLGEGCNRDICFFAHTSKELRAPCAAAPPQGAASGPEALGALQAAGDAPGVQWHAAAPAGGAAATPGMHVFFPPSLTGSQQQGQLPTSSGAAAGSHSSSLAFLLSAQQQQQQRQQAGYSQMLLQEQPVALSGMMTQQLLLGGSDSAGGSAAAGYGGGPASNQGPAPSMPGFMERLHAIDFNAPGSSSGGSAGHNPASLAQQQQQQQQQHQQQQQQQSLMLMPLRQELAGGESFSSQCSTSSNVSGAALTSSLPMSQWDRPQLGALGVLSSSTYSPQQLPAAVPAAGVAEDDSVLLACPTCAPVHVRPMQLSAGYGAQPQQQHGAQLHNYQHQYQQLQQLMFSPAGGSSGVPGAGVPGGVEVLAAPALPLHGMYAAMFVPPGSSQPQQLQTLHLQPPSTNQL